eukprot:c4331_g1_i1.p1 GENE.c4331_g1_i1~~c4331_g1_i1.p1  ORF type:complete len:147 (+),score=27.85 c4331_g1_i1:90-530(+)
MCVWCVGFHPQQNSNCNTFFSFHFAFLIRFNNSNETKNIDLLCDFDSTNNNNQQKKKLRHNNLGNQSISLIAVPRSSKLHQPHKKIGFKKQCFQREKNHPQMLKIVHKRQENEMNKEPAFRKISGNSRIFRHNNNRDVSFDQKKIQ